MAQDDFDYEVTEEVEVKEERLPTGEFVPMYVPQVQPVKSDNTGTYIAVGAVAVGVGLLWWKLRDKGETTSNGGRPTTGNGGNGGDDGPTIGDGGEPTDNGGPPSDDPIFGEAPFPPEPAGVQWDHLDRLARKAEEITKMDGLRDYLMATAEWESDGVPTAWNNTSDAKPALRLFCKSFNYNDRFKNNPWRPAVCDWSDPRAERWGWSGGWFQMMTATALATGDEYGVNMDPARIFDPPFQVAFAADLVNDFKKAYGAQTWGDVRAGWALPKWAKPSNDSEGKAKTIDNFKKALNRVGRGVDTSLWKTTFTAKHYPGFKSVLHQLMESEGRL